MLILNMKTAKYKKSFAIAKYAIKLDSFVVKETSTLNTKVSWAELTISGYFAEHHAPSQQVNHRVEICKKNISRKKKNIHKF